MAQRQACKSKSDRRVEPAPVEPEPMAFSNGIRLTGRQWLGLGVFGLAACCFRASALVPGGEFRSRAGLPDPARPEQRLLALRRLPGWPPTMTTRS